jgi:hypothetical protein
MGDGRPCAERTGGLPGPVRPLGPAVWFGRATQRADSCCIVTGGRPLSVTETWKNARRATPSAAHPSPRRESPRRKAARLFVVTGCVPRCPWPIRWRLRARSVIPPTGNRGRLADGSVKLSSRSGRTGTCCVAGAPAGKRRADTSWIESAVRHADWRVHLRAERCRTADWSGGASGPDCRAARSSLGRARRVWAVRERRPTCRNAGSRALAGPAVHGPTGVI